MAVVRTVLPRKGLIEPGHGLTGYEADMDANMTLLDTNVVFLSDLPVQAGYYLASAGAGLTLNIAAGIAFAGGALVIYAGGTLTLTASATNYVFLDSSAGYAPGKNTTGFPAGCMPIAAVATSSGAISSITDRRTPFMLGTGSGGVTFSGDLTGTDGGPQTVVGIQGIPVTTTAPTDGEVMAYSAAAGKIVFQTGGGSGGGVAATVSVTASGAGNFTVAHSLGRAPSAAIIQMTSADLIWFQSTKFDAANLYLTASEAGATADVALF